MVKSDGKCKIDGVEIGDVRLHMFGTSPTLYAKYAFSNTNSGSRFGSGRRTQNWSESTWAKVRELLQSMEQDIVSELFEGEATTGSVEEKAPPTTDDVPSL